MRAGVVTVRFLSEVRDHRAALPPPPAPRGALIVDRSPRSAGDDRARVSSAEAGPPRIAEFRADSRAAPRVQTTAC